MLVSEPDQVHLSWTGDASTTMTVVWHTGSGVGHQVQYRPTGTSAWSTVTGSSKASGTSGALHQAQITGLTGDTAYDYRVRASGGWSQVRSFRTAPANGPLEVIYFADTGIAWRLDGLTTGTEAVLDSIAAENPTLVLGGGDYAYLDTDSRFSTVDEGIDAWFNQIQDLASRIPMMPTYGNHEVLLTEGFDPWADRFATPTGVGGPIGSVNSRGNFSFDVGNVHFISITAVTNGQPLSAGQIDWITQDVEDAPAAGADWIIPYFHSGPFSNGTNHPSNLALRNQIGPLFEDLDIPIALYSHDQSYERTYPLVDASSTISGSTNQRTSHSLSCYSQADGVIWVKTSPAGKLSNISGTFSPWESGGVPTWTAVRDNTHHHYLMLEVDGDSLQVTAYNLTSNGTRTVADQFQIGGTC
jgi:hypothetical protein